VGSWAVASDQGKASKELHIVYTSAETTTAYRKEGRFPDGAALAKEELDTVCGVNRAVEHSGDCLEIGGHAAIAIGGEESLAGRNF
jgi:hypothetical protein